MNHILVAVIATGDPRRGGMPKLCLPWARTTILGHVIDRWREAGAEDVLVVHPRGLSMVTQELDRLDFPVEQRAPSLASGRGSMGAIMTAARYAMQNPFLSHLIVMAGDQPQVCTETLMSLLDACESAPGRAVQPVFRGVAGYPCALPASVIGELATTHATTLRGFMDSQHMPIADLTCQDSGILFDVETPAEHDHAYRAACAAQTQPILT